jgi:MinD-like ATPase involved in chromosome partitioning or flagellar assembly
MALVNVAVELALSGRRVLLVDFDLEAPGLDTFNLPRPQSDTPGVVDYVTEYLKTEMAPAFENFVYKSPLIGLEQGQLWIMPSGKQDESYAARLSAIDWKELYQKREGYLLFEDLKSQWQSLLQPDYVLIDSRTGHTDVGGICTRHLPDSVVVLFFPNEQSRRGLEKIVKEIRHEEVGARKKRIQLHFVIGNVPELDDEDQILAGMIKRLKDSLQYDEAAAVIHHYNSLMLLNQSVFTLDRPKSRLAQEYRNLTKAIRRSNTDDREGVLEFLGSVAVRVGRKREPISALALEERLDEIQKKHGNDGEVLRALSRVRRRQHRIGEAIALLDQAMATGLADAELLLARAELNAMEDNNDAAIADLSHVLEMNDVTDLQVNVAVRLLADLDEPVLNRLPSSRALSALDLDGQLTVSRELQFSRESLAVAAELLRSVATRQDLTSDQRNEVKSNLSLALIGLGRFDEAMTIISSARPVPEALDIQEAFNYAMAQWGQTKSPSKELFARVIDLDEPRESSGPNYDQCLSIAFYAVGDIPKALQRLADARQQMMTLPRPDFSAWQYLRVDPTQFLKDLDSLEELIRGKAILPDFMHAVVSQKSESADD